MWIKLHRELLDDEAFMRMSEVQRYHLWAIWLLASQKDGRIPNDPTFVARRIGAETPVDLDALRDAGWLIPDETASANASNALADRSQHASEALAVDALAAAIERRYSLGELRALRDAITTLADKAKAE